MNGFFWDIDKITKENTCFMKVIGTTPTMQITVMSIDDQIGEEIHPGVTQFIKVEQGRGLAIIKDRNYFLSEGSGIMIPPNTRHNIINLSRNGPLKLYSLYSPPEHREDHVEC